MSRPTFEVLYDANYMRDVLHIKQQTVGQATEVFVDISDDEVLDALTNVVVAEQRRREIARRKAEFERAEREYEAADARTRAGRVDYDRLIERNREARDALMEAKAALERAKA